MDKLSVYRCELCGNIVEVMHVGGGTLSCCGQPMKRQVENTTDAATEKHVPVVEKTDGGFLVKVGSVAHPMADDLWIQWIELIVDGRVIAQHLDPGQKPEALFAVEADGATARAYCNLHGLWKG